MSNNNNQLNGQFRLFEAEESKLDIKRIIFRYLRLWYLFVIFVGLGFAGSYFYIRYAVPQYLMRGTLLIKDKARGNTNNEELFFQDLGIMSGLKNLENEIQILESRTLMKEVVEKLGIDITITALGRIRNNELYGDLRPFSIDSLYFDSTELGKTFLVKVLDQDQYQISDGREEKIVPFGGLADFGYSHFVLSPTTRIEVKNYPNFEIRFSEPKRIASRYSSRVSVKPTKPSSSVVEISLKDPVTQKGIDIINTLVQVYNEATIKDKTRVSDNTLKFISDRLNDLTQELENVETEVESYKINKAIPIDIISNESNIITQNTQLEGNLVDLEVQLSLVRSIKDFISNPENKYTFVPTELGDQMSTLSPILIQINELLSKRSRLKGTGVTSELPALQELEGQIETMRYVLQENLNKIENNLSLSKSTLENRINNLQSQIKSIPTKNRRLQEIIRKQNIKESLYLYLLQKWEETALTKAVAVPDSRVIDTAIAGGPVEPRTTIIYAIGLLLGLGIPFSLITVRDLLDDKIYSKREVEQETGTPILGAIKRSTKDSPIVVSKGSRSSISEMFRLLRTNIQFLNPGTEQQTILVTSSMSGEGKSFIALNTGISLALSQKKVVLIGLDLRKPKLSKYITEGNPPSTGLTNYLIGGSTLDEILRPTNILDNLHFISSGPVPPNPAELILTEETRQLFDELKSRYDYIIVDTPPVGLVTDALLLKELTTSSIFVVRSGMTKKGQLELINDIYQAKKLNNPAIVINGVKRGQGYGYGHSYGYGYGYGNGYGYYED